MRAWQMKMKLASCVESGWDGAPRGLKHVMGALEGVGTGIAGFIEGARSSRIEVDIPENIQIVSVGGVSWSGDGKTSLSAHIASMLAGEGVSVGLVTRGYGSGSRKATRVPGGELQGRGADAARWGDEAVMLGACLPGVPVWAGTNREGTIKAAMSESLDVLVMDDGLSLSGLKKDLEVALLSTDLACLRRLPAGPLRRALTDTAHAHVVGVRAPDTFVSTEDFASEATRLLEKAGASRHPWFGFKLEPAERSCSGDVLLVAGIGHPERFQSTARCAGYTPVGHIWFPDHHAPNERDFLNVAEIARIRGARSILVTAKDAPRFPSTIAEFKVEVLFTRLVVFTNQGVFYKLVRGIVQKAVGRGRD